MKFKEIFEAKEIDIQATLLSFAKAGYPHPAVGRMPDSKDKVKKTLVQWADENGIKVVYK